MQQTRDLPRAMPALIAIISLALTTVAPAAPPTTAEAWLQRAEKELAGIETTVDQAEALSLLADTYREAGDRAAVARLAKRCLALAMAVDDVDDRDLVLGYAASSLAGTGDAAGARAALDKIQDWITRAHDCANVAYVQASMDSLDEYAKNATTAANLARGFDDEAERDEVFASIASVHAAAGRVKEADALAAQIRQTSSRANAWAWIASELALKGDVASARERIAKARPLIAQVEDEYEQAWVALSVAYAWMDMGDMAAAEKQLPSVPDEELRVSAFCALAAAYGKQGKFDQAAAVLPWISLVFAAAGLDFDDESYYLWWDVGWAYGSSNDLDKFAGMIDGLETPQARVHACAGVAQGLIDRKKPAK